jgi:predicted permease
LPPLFERIANRTRELPGVQRAGVVSFLPLGRGATLSRFQIEGRQPEADRVDSVSVPTQIVTPGYFEAMGMRSVEGRLFTADDRAGGPPVVLVSETFARTLFPGESVLRQRLSFGTRTQGRQWFEIVGVLRDVRHNGLDAEPRPEVYFPAAQAADLQFTTDGPFVVLRTSGDPAAALPALRQALYEIDPMVVIESAMTMEARISTSVAQPRFYALLFSAFSLLALVLASVGLYGVLSYVVAQRRREIGIRMALGAGRGQVVRLVLQQAFVLIAAGTVLGLAAAWGLSRLLDHQLFGVATADRTTHVVAVLLLAAVGAMACYAPARRASRVDPAVALRAE